VQNKTKTEYTNEKNKSNDNHNEKNKSNDNHSTWMWYCNMDYYLHDAKLYGALWYRRMMSKHYPCMACLNVQEPIAKRFRSSTFKYFKLITILVTNPCIRTVFEHSLLSVDASTEQNLASK